MPSPKSGKQNNLVAADSPNVAEEADNANPGKAVNPVADPKQNAKGKHKQAKVDPYKPPEPGEEKKKSWVAIKLVDQNGEPVPGEKYRITLPDSKVAEGTLGANGEARVDGIDPGNCKIEFPKLDRDAWSRN